ncbi:hypothetical protein [Malaciobacter mytili]|uniref:Uncharacterized protein n=1 Tax=Malaciobacter mytili LMG 24559 TaxID=1032238 RepID=A0AAX2AHN1_9BACT|nr:hypothetical protein [Malaciobacter mytili]AXH14334.1 hypothetical protein AMYT_0741 [Malaciobacter mytili LMG 24559]RXK16090.1 hypothetical protein CP985_05810 [Malaciobacter mytili LMG 24559]
MIKKENIANVKKKNLNEIKSKIHSLNLCLKELVKDIKTCEEDLKNIDTKELKNILFYKSKRQLQKEYIKKCLEEKLIKNKEIKEKRVNFNDIFLFTSLLLPILIFLILFLS